MKTTDCLKLMAIRLNHVNEELPSFADQQLCAQELAHMFILECKNNAWQKNDLATMFGIDDDHDAFDWAYLKTQIALRLLLLQQARFAVQEASNGK